MTTGNERPTLRIFHSGFSVGYSMFSNLVRPRGDSWSRLCDMLLKEDDIYDFKNTDFKFIYGDTD